MSKYDELEQMNYRPLTAADIPELGKWFAVRPNKSCDSVPLSDFLYNHLYPAEFYRTEAACLVRFQERAAWYSGSIPYCRTEVLPYYFQLQEAYFNEVLHQPLTIYYADEEGVDLLRKSGVLENYEVKPEEDMRDYLYDGESLRTLSGKKYAKKRNHIHKFLELYEGRWTYRALTPEDKNTVFDLLDKWEKEKEAEGNETGVGKDEKKEDVGIELKMEIAGIRNFLSEKILYGCARIGGIFLDGQLAAFSIGAMNPSEKMAVIDVEKAEPEIPGLYQMINQQFLLHEFPDAVLVNREDDVGLEGLRQSKMSYYPIGFENKYILKQKDFQK